MIMKPQQQKQRTRERSGERHGASLNENTNPLFQAILQRDIELFKKSFKSVYFATCTEDTVLMYAAKLNFAPAVAMIIDYCKDNPKKSILKLRNYQGFTALIFASMYKSDQSLKLLLPFELQIRDNQGKTALMHAVCSQNDYAVEALAQYESKITDDNGETALIKAIFHKNQQAICVLQQYEKNVYYVCRSQKRSSVQLNIEYQNERLRSCQNIQQLLSEDSKSPLHVAVDTEDLFIVKMLANSCKGMKDSQNRTSLEYGLDQLLFIDEENESDESVRKMVSIKKICQFLTQFSEERKNADEIDRRLEILGIRNIFIK